MHCSVLTSSKVLILRSSVLTYSKVVILLSGVFTSPKVDNQRGIVLTFFSRLRLGAAVYSHILRFGLMTSSSRITGVNESLVDNISIYFFSFPSRLLQATSQR